MFMIFRLQIYHLIFQGDVCFAHYLLLLDVPVNECNSLGHTAREIAIKLGHIHFLKFLQEYESGII